jgi:hypothetical protein
MGIHRLSRHSRAGGNPNSKNISNQRRYNRFYQPFFIQNYFVFLLLSFIKKKVTKEMTPHKSCHCPYGVPSCFNLFKGAAGLVVASNNSNRSSLFFLE